MQSLRELGEFTFPALLKNSVKKFGPRNALSNVNGTPITYYELEEASQNISRLLYNLGIKKGDRVGLFSTSCPQWGEAYFGIVNYGAIAVPLLPDFTASEVASILEHAQISCLIVAKKMYNKVENLSIDICPTIVQIEDFSLLRGTFIYDFQDELQNEIIKESDTASIIYTSGTTGKPKGVELTHKNLIWTAIQCQCVHRVSYVDKCLSFLPLSHVYEFTIGFTMQLLNGSSIYYLGRPPTVSSLLPAFKKIKPTIVLSVPMILEKVYKNKILPSFTKNEFTKKLYNIRFFQRILHRIAGHQLMKTFGGRIKFFGIGGAKIDPLVEYFLKDARFPYAIGYGLTETSPLLAGSGPKNTVPGTVGPVMSGVELAVLNPDPKTGIGEIVAKGCNIMKGYYKEPELTKAVFTKETDSIGAGWFKTGDLGEIRNGIWLSLKGRLKNVILNSSGENIYPEDIEFVLNQHPLVQESLVVEGESGLVALVQLDEKSQNILEKVSGAVRNVAEDIQYQYISILNEIQYFVNQKVNKMSHISKVIKVELFQKTASQKIKRYIYGKSDTIEPINPTKVINSIKSINPIESKDSNTSIEGLESIGSEDPTSNK